MLYFTCLVRLKATRLALETHFVVGVRCSSNCRVSPSVIRDFHLRRHLGTKTTSHEGNSVAWQRQESTSHADSTPTSQRSALSRTHNRADLIRLCKHGPLDDALRAVNDLAQGDADVSSRVLHDLLLRCTKQQDGVTGRQVHSLIIKKGLESDTFFGYHLIQLYSACGSLLEAQGVFNKLLEPDKFAWLAIIVAYSRHDQAGQAVDMYFKMRDSGLEPDGYTYVAVIKACARSAALTAGRLIHTDIMQRGLELNVFVASALIEMYMKCASLVDARSVFDRLSEKDVVTWNAMMGGYAQDKNSHEALALYEQMLDQGVEPNRITLLSALKACSSAGFEVLGQIKTLHAHVVETGLESDLFIATALIGIYSKCERLEDARQIFDGLPKRDVATWNAMIAGYAQHGHGWDAIQLFYAMQESGFHPDKVTLLSILRAASSLAALDQGKLIHHHFVQNGFLTDVDVGTRLICMYAKCGSVEDARQVFDSLPVKNLVSWNEMIAGYAELGCGSEAMELFLQLEHEGLQPSNVTIVQVLKACSVAAVLAQVRVLHAHVRKLGAESDLFVASSLIDLYSKCGSVDDARRVFDRLPRRDLVTWNAMIAGYAQLGRGEDALTLFQQMEKERMHPNQFTWVSMLKACSGLDQGKILHAKILQSGLDSDVVVGNSLIDMYAKCDSLENARAVFDRLQKGEQITWTTMIAGYVQDRNGEEALQLFKRMQCEGMYPSKLTLVSLLKACTSSEALDQGKVIHDYIIDNGLELDVLVGNTLVFMYCKCGSMKDAHKVFDTMPVRNLASWNTMILGYAQDADCDEAFRLFHSMQQEALQPDNYTFVGCLKACSTTSALEQGKWFHLQTMDASLELDTFVASTLIDMYGKCGSMEDARKLFDKLPTRPLVAWTAMVAGYAQQGDGQEAFKFFRDMQHEGMLPDKVTILSILKACSSVAALSQGKIVHAQALKQGLQSDVTVTNSLVDMYAKCGSLESAREVFEGAERRDLVSWNAMIAGYAQHGRGREALDFFQLMRNEGMHPDNVTFLSLLSACSHAGLLEDGLLLFRSMPQTPEVEHHVRMVDLLCRSGCLHEGEDFIKQLPADPDIPVWMSLLGACRTYGSVELGRRAFEAIVRLDAANAAAHVLMAEIYASAGNYQEEAELRRRMLRAGAKKEPGRTWMEYDSEVHTFVVEDERHSDRKEIYAQLESLMEAIAEDAGNHIHVGLDDKRAQ